MFEDIRIVGLDDGKSHRTDANNAMYDMYLTLSASAPAMWSKMFEYEHQSRRSNDWRKAHASGNHIVIHCPPSEVEKHFDGLKLSVKNANDQYRVHEINQEQEQARKRQAELADRDQLTAIKNKLKFD